MTKAKADKEQLVNGVKIALVKQAMVIAALKAEEVEVPKTLPEQVAALLDRYAANTKRDKLAKCVACGGIAPDALEVCPFCGDGGPEVSEEVADVAEQVVQEAQAKPTKHKATPERVDAAPTTALAKVQPVAVVERLEIVGETEKPTQQLLDTVTQKLLAMKSSLALHYWHLGRQGKVVLDRELWKMRTDAAGKPVYTTFNQWCEKELRMKAKVFYGLMDAAAEFTEDQARRLGMTKLQLVMGAPKNAKAELMAAAEAGASKREIAERVKQERAKAGVTKRQTGRGGDKIPPGKGGRLSAAEKAAGKTKRDTAATGRMTVAMVEGKVRLDAWCKPAKRDEDPKPAKRLADEPYTKLELTNGVVMFLSLAQKPSGQIVFIVETRRAK
jgi:hypothetical protein